MRDTETAPIAAVCPSIWPLTLVALIIYYFGTLAVFSGILFGSDLLVDVAELPVVGEARSRSVLDRTVAADALDYARLASDGYDRPPPPSISAAFFPAYPLVVRAVQRTTGLPTAVALLVVSNACGFACAALLAGFVARRFPERAAELAPMSIVALSFLPATFFFRLGYTESLCLMLLLLFLLAMAQGRSVWLVALLAGAASGARSVGLAAALPALWYAWRHLPPGPMRFVKLAALGPLAAWGLLGFLAFQWAVLGDPLAFAVAHGKVRFREASSPAAKLVSLATLEPIWSAYLPDSPGYWRKVPRRALPPFDLQAMNPAYFLFAAGAIGYCAWRRLVNGPELLLASLLLLIPYLTRSYDLCMGSQGRFALMIVPQYLAAGDVLVRLPAWMQGVLVALSALLMFSHAALFAAGYFLI